MLHKDYELYKKKKKKRKRQLDSDSIEVKCVVQNVRIIYYGEFFTEKVLAGAEGIGLAPGPGNCRDCIYKSTKTITCKYIYRFGDPVNAQTHRNDLRLSHIVFKLSR